MCYTFPMTKYIFKSDKLKEDVVLTFGLLWSMAKASKEEQEKILLEQHE